MSQPEWYYRKRLTSDWQADSASLARAVDDVFEPDSVMDLGCGVGHHLHWFRQHETGIRGVEINDHAIEHAVIPDRFIDQHDLTMPYYPDWTADVVLCIEVAEHLPESSAETLVDTITRCANNGIVFSAATPDAHGRGHVNEQPRTYWREKFTSRGWRMDREVLELLTNRVTTKAKHWIPDRLFVFR